MGSRTDLGEEFPQNHNQLKTLFSTYYSRNNQILIFVVERWSRVKYTGFDPLPKRATKAVTKQTERPLSLQSHKIKIYGHWTEAGEVLYAGQWQRTLAQFRLTTSSFGYGIFNCFD